MIELKEAMAKYFHRRNYYTAELEERERERER
jgi:hypothetical protein